MVKETETVLSDEDVQFLDGVTGKPVFTNEEEISEEEETGKEEVVEEEEVEEVAEEELVTKQDIAAIEKKLGRVLTKAEVLELNEKARAGEIEEKVEIPEDFSLIDSNKLPKEIQPHFKRMFASFTKAMQGFADTKKKADIFDYVQEHPEFLAERLGLQVPKAEVSKETKTDEVADFLAQLNIPEDHELAPAIKGIATAVARLAKGVEEKDKSRDGATLQERINTFLNLDRNKGMREDLALVRAMDRLGKESPRLYSDLDRLKRLAEADMGRPAKAIQKQTKENVYKLFRDMKEAKKKGVTKPSGAVSMSTKKPRNVAESWKQVEEKLKNQ